MKFKILLIVLLVFLVSSVTGLTAAMEAQIVHVPLVTLNAGEKLYVQARVDGATERVVFMRLYYKSPEQQSYDYIDMVPSGAGYIGELSSDKINPPELDYFIMALMSSKQVLTDPATNPYGKPHIVQIKGTAVPRSTKPAVPSELPAITPPVQAPAVPETSEQSPSAEQGSEDSPWLALSPENGEEFGKDEEILIAVSFTGTTDDSVDAKSVHLFLDGQDVTQSTDVSNYLMTFTVPQISPGRHTVLVNGLLYSGKELPVLSWSFTMKGEKKKIKREVPLAHGRIFAESRQENISDIGFTDNNIGGAVSGKYGIAKYDARVYFTSREDGRFQPRNRFTFDLQLPVLGVTVGDTYPRFNDLMLWGKRVRGIYGRLHTGFFNVDVVHGETVRRVSALNQVAVDTTTGDTLKSVVTGVDSLFIAEFGTFRQKLLGIRSSFGSGRTFQLGFNLLKVRDDTTSLGPGQFSVAPQDNIVVGSDFLLALAKRRIEFRAATAISLLSNDISTGPLSKAEIEDQFDVDLPFDPADFSKYLIINASTTPLDPRDLTSLAYNFSMGMNFFRNNLQVGYKRIGSQYMSLGNSFLRNNLRGFYLNDRVRMFQNKFYLNFGLEHYKDNFNPDDDNAPTNLRTVTTGFSFYPGQGLPNITFNLRNHNRDNNIDSLLIDLSNGLPDTTDNREDNNTKDLTVQLSYDAHFFNLRHSISLSYITSDRNDRFNQSRVTVLGLPSTETSSNVEVFSVRTRYEIPLVTTINFARNDNSFSGGLNSFNFKMFGAKAEYKLLRQRLNTYFGINFTTASGVSATDTTATGVTSITDYKRTTFNFGARYEFIPGNFILLDGNLVSFNDKGSTLNTTTGVLDPNPSFTDRIFRVYYEKRF